MPSDQRDRETLARLAGGDSSALGELMAQWGRRVYAFIERMCGRLGCSDDLYQEVWLRVYRHCGRYDAARPFRPYLFTIATNCCRSALKRGATRADTRSLDGDDLPPPVSADDAPPDALITREQCAHLRAAVDRLPEAQRSVVLLYLLSGSDYAEIATTLDKRVGTVRVHMHHALKTLRSNLRPIRPRSRTEVDRG